MAVLLGALFTCLFVAPSAKGLTTNAVGLVEYVSFENDSYTLRPWFGDDIALLTPNDTTLDASVMTRIVETLDQAYQYYVAATGEQPKHWDPTTLYDRDVVAVVGSTCGAGCAYLGFNGIELLEPHFTILYDGVRDNDQYDQVLFYELGCNFWFYDNQLKYHDPDNDPVVTGYAVYMRFLSMDAAGATGGPYNGYPFETFRSTVTGLMDAYVDDPSLNWGNTFRIGQAPDNALGLGGTDLIASLLMRIGEVFGDSSWPGSFWQQAALRPEAGDTQTAVDNFVLAACAAVGQNLSGIFSTTWKFPVSSAASQEAQTGWGAPVVLVDPPTITTQPVARPHVVGSALMLSVVAEGDGALSYQWLKDGGGIDGATGRTLVLDNVQLSDAGDYSVQVSNSGGSVTSANAQLTVVIGVAPAAIAGPITNPASGHQYYLLGQSTWVEAEAAAQVLGGHLATISSASEQEWVVSTFSNWGGLERSLWIGLYDSDPRNNAADLSARQSEFVWSSGETVTYSNWSNGEPNNWSDMGEYYVHTFYPGHATDAGKWNDAPDSSAAVINGVVEIGLPVFFPIVDARRLTIEAEVSAHLEDAGGTNSVEEASDSAFPTSSFAPFSDQLEVDISAFVPDAGARVESGSSQTSAISGSRISAVGSARVYTGAGREDIGRGAFATASAESVFDLSYLVPDHARLTGDATVFGPPLTSPSHGGVTLSQWGRGDVLTVTNEFSHIPVPIAANLEPGVYTLLAEVAVGSEVSHHEISWRQSGEYEFNCVFQAIDVGPSSLLLNNYSATQWSPIYGPEEESPSLAKHGNPANGVPAGDQTYTGTPLNDTNWVVELWGAEGRDQPEAALHYQARTRMQAIDDNLSHLQGLFLGGSVALSGISHDQPATFQVRAYDSQDGSVHSWADVLTNTSVLRGASRLIVVAAASNRILGGLESFNVHLPATSGPEFVVEPRSRTNVVGSALMLSVEAEGDGPLSYQWLKDGSWIAGATGRTLVLDDVQSGDAGAYAVRVSDGLSSVTSSSAELTVVAAQVPTSIAGPITNPANGHQYYLLDQSTWVEAEAAAQVLGGHLVSITDASEQDWVLSSFGNWGGLDRCLWIGLFDSDPLNNAADPTARQAEFVWSDGTASAYVNWQIGQPNNYGEAGEFYAHMRRPSHASAGAWNDTTDTRGSGIPFNGVVEVTAAPIVLLSDERQVDAEATGYQAGDEFQTDFTESDAETLRPSPPFSAFNEAASADMMWGGCSATQHSVVDVSGFVASGGVDLELHPRLEGQSSASAWASGSVTSLFRVTFTVQEPRRYSIEGSFSNDGGGFPATGTISLTSSEGGELIRTSEDVSTTGSLLPGTYTLEVDLHAGDSVSNGRQSLYDGVYSLQFSFSTPPLEIVTQPRSRTNVVGSALMLSVEAEGDGPLSYQWLKDGGWIAGATRRTLVLDDVQSGDAGAYAVRVFDGLSSVTSSAAELTVVAAAVPTSIAGPITNPANGHQYYLLDQSTWVEAEAVAQTMGGHLVTINDAAEQEWVLNRFGNWGELERSLWIGLYDSDPLNNEADPTARQAEFVWSDGTASAYVNWQIGQPNNYGEAGEFYAQMRQPSHASAGAWNDSTDTRGYGIPFNGVVELAAAPIVLLSDERQVDAEATGYQAPDSTASDAETLRPSPPFSAFNEAASADMMWGGCSATQHSVVDVSGFVASGGVNLELHPHLEGQSSASAWASGSVTSLFRVTFTVQEPRRYSIEGSFAQANEGQPAFGEISLTSVEGGELIQTSEDVSTTGSLLPGTYTLEVDLHAGDSVSNGRQSQYAGAYALQFSFSTPPLDIVTQPRSRTNVVGSALMLSVEAEGDGPLSYQWLKDGGWIDGATARILVLDDVQSDDASAYAVQVSDGLSSVTSSAAELTVVAAAVPTSIAGPITNPVNGHQYYLLDQSTWVEAEAAAQALGGHLVTVNDASEQDWVLSSFGNWGGLERSLWIGLYDSDPLNNATETTARQAEFLWASGETGSYANWASGEPNNYWEMGEYYVHTYHSSYAAQAGRWNDTWDTDFNQRPLHGVVEVDYVAPQQVVLQISTAEDMIEISWPSSASQAVLQQTETLTQPDVTWHDVEAQPMIEGDEAVIVITNSQSPRFFRLVEPGQ